VENTRFGVTAGLNYSRVSNAHNPSGPRYTFQGGALALIPVGKANQFLYSLKYCTMVQEKQER
jgi:hypothetical protein